MGTLTCELHVMRDAIGDFGRQVLLAEELIAHLRPRRLVELVDRAAHCAHRRERHAARAEVRVQQAPVVHLRGEQNGSTWIASGLAHAITRLKRRRQE